MALFLIVLHLQFTFSIYMAVNSQSYIAETCCRWWILIKLGVRPSVIGVRVENVPKIGRQTSKQFSSNQNIEKLHSNLCPEMDCFGVQLKDYVQQ
jgi:hypothetical protein